MTRAVSLLVLFMVFLILIKVQNPFSFADSMFICLNQICGYTDLCHEAEQLRKEPYSSDNAGHEKRLMQVTTEIFVILNL